jgi:MFS superfamily sulfate permease-like transporter
MPVFSWLRGYDRGWLRGDVVAGLTVWAVLVPEALAYATIAGVSPVVGLYAAPGALLLYAAFGSSRHLVTGPMAATAALSAAAVADLATAGSDDFLQLTITLALVTGALAVLAGLFRLGFLASFISEPVLKGFIIGLALTIIVGQVPKLLGIDSGGGDFFEKARGVIENAGETDGLTLLLGALSLAAVLALRRLAPLVPGSLLVVAASTAAVALLDLDDEGVAVVGSVSSGLPSFGAPDVSLAKYGELAAGAVGVALVAFAESLGAAKAYSTRPCAMPSRRPAASRSSGTA